MKLEFLLLSEEQRKKLEAYRPDNATVSYQSLKDHTGSIFCYSVRGENETSAKILSAISDYVISRFSVTVLANEASAYFNNHLYLIISEFERKLRKLLYIASAVAADKNAVKNINDLEEKELGAIFSLLFLDATLRDNIKKSISSLQNHEFTKDAVIQLIDSIEENILWDKLLGKDAVPTLRNCFNDIRVYRNAVMHSHNISWKRYTEIKKAYSKTNEELEEKINSIIQTGQEAHLETRFNDTLEDALSVQERVYECISRMMKKVIEAYEPLPEGSNLAQILGLINSVYAQKPEDDELPRMLNEDNVLQVLREHQKAQTEFQETMKMLSPEDIQMLRELKNKENAPENNQA